jgi:hypothetical protein
MNALRHGVAAAFDTGLNLWSSACVFGLRYRPVLLALPLCSSMCFFGLRFVLSTLGVHV